MPIVLFIAAIVTANALQRSAEVKFQNASTKAEKCVLARVESKRLANDREEVLESYVNRLNKENTENITFEQAKVRIEKTKVELVIWQNRVKNNCGEF